MVLQFSSQRTVFKSRAYQICAVPCAGTDLGDILDNIRKYWGWANLGPYGDLKNYAFDLWYKSRW